MYRLSSLDFLFFFPRVGNSGQNPRHSSINAMATFAKKKTKMKLDSAVVDVSFVVKQTTASRLSSECRRFELKTLKCSIFTARHSFQEQMGCADIKQPFGGSKTKLTESRGNN